MTLFLTLAEPLVALLLLSVSLFGPEATHFFVVRYQLRSSFYLLALGTCVCLALVGFFTILDLIDGYFGQLLVGTDWTTFLYEPLTGGGLVLFTVNALLVYGIIKFGIHPMIRDFEQWRRDRKQWEAKHQKTPSARG